MSEASPNGWPVSDDPEVLGIVPLEVGGVPFSPGVRGGKVHEVLSYVANAIHNRVQKANATYGCWGYNYRPNVNSPGDWSNHASGTAIDYNATLHPNGSPTVTNWTDGQIAEIHKILDEVGGVVRWGGDYVGTPDAMHFEIDVPPASLGEDFVVPKSHQVVPIGAPSFGNYYSRSNLEDLPSLTEMSVSYPTLARYVSFAYWSFTATKTGRISIDAMLSHYMDDKIEAQAPYGPTVTLRVYKPTFATAGNVGFWNFGPALVNSSSFFGFGLQRNQGRALLDVQAGQTYVIYTAANQEYPWIRTVVRIGDYAEEAEWIQPPDQEAAWRPTSGFNFPFDPNFKMNSAVLAQSVGYRGGDFSLHRGFGGPTPGTQSDAIACCWRWNRRFYADMGVTWWGGSNGTGPFVCPVLSGFIDKPSSVSWDGTVGYRYWSTESSLGAFYYQDIEWEAYATSLWADPSKIAGILSKNGQGVGDTQVTYLPVLRPTDILEWESQVCELVDVDFAWDEVAGHDYTDGNLVIKWYVGPSVSQDDRISGEWGPYEASFSSGTWYGQGAHGPEDWVGTQHHLGNTTGGASGWLQLPAEYWDEPIRFTAIPEAMLSDAVPHFNGAEPPLANYFRGVQYKDYVYIRLRSRVRPSRYRIFLDPGIEDLDWAGVNAVSMAYDDGGKVLY